MEQELFAVCAPGLEPFTADELRALGAGAIRPEPGGVAFRGGLRVLYAREPDAANGDPRAAAPGRVPRARLRAAAPAREPAAPSRAASRPGAPSASRVTCSRSRLRHTGAVAERVHQAIADRLRQPEVPVAGRASERAVRSPAARAGAARARPLRREPRRFRRAPAPARLAQGRRQGAAARDAGGGAAARVRLGCARRRSPIRSVAREPSRSRRRCWREARAGPRAVASRARTGPASMPPSRRRSRPRRRPRRSASAPPIRGADRDAGAIDGRAGQRRSGGRRDRHRVRAAHDLGLRAAARHGLDRLQSTLWRAPARRRRPARSVRALRRRAATPLPRLARGAAVRGPAPGARERAPARSRARAGATAACRVEVFTGVVPGAA